MELAREAMVKEAVRRMKVLKMLPQPIKEFEKEGMLNMSEQMGALYWLSEEEKKMVADFEAENGGVVYHVIHSYTNIGELYSFLYVSQYDEEWDDDMADLKDGCAVAYVLNKTMPDCSEFGTIGVEPRIGGVVRTW